MIQPTQVNVLLKIKYLYSMYPVFSVFFSFEKSRPISASHQHIVFDLNAVGSPYVFGTKNTSVFAIVAMDLLSGGQKHNYMYLIQAYVYISV